MEGAIDDDRARDSSRGINIGLLLLGSLESLKPNSRNPRRNRKIGMIQEVRECRLEPEFG